MINESSSLPQNAVTTNDTLEDLTSFIQAQSQEWLAQTLIALVKKQPEVQQILTMLQQSSGTDNLKELQKSISSLIGRPRFMDYKQSRSFANKLNAVVDMFEQMRLRGQTEDCVLMLEYALERVIKVYAQSDDSGGQINAVIHALGDLYRDVCISASDAKKPTAARMLKLLLLDDWGFINHHDLLAIMGEAAVQALEDKVLEAWLKLTPKKAYSFDAYDSKIESLMIAFALKNKDVELLIRIYSREPVQEYSYLKLIEICQAFNRQREAVQWAEIGLKAHSKSNRIRSQLVKMYTQDGLDDEASELLWQNFLQQPDPTNYLALKQHTGAEWQTWRTRIMDKLIAIEQKASANYSTRYVQNKLPDASLRIFCLLAEGSIEEARLVVQSHDCNHACRHALAKHLHPQYPTEAGLHLQTIIAEITQVSSPRAYEQTCALLKEMQVWLPAHAFEVYLQNLKLENKARPSFIKLLNAF